MHNTKLNFCHFSWNPRICFLCRRVLIGRTFWAYEGLRGNKFISNILYKNVSITKNLHIFFFRSPITFTKFSLTVKIPILNYVEMVLRMRRFIFLTKTFASVNDSKVWKPSWFTWHILKNILFHISISTPPPPPLLPSPAPKSLEILWLRILNLS